MAHPLYTPAVGGYTGGMIYDVTLPLSPALTCWPGDPPVERTEIALAGVRLSRWILGSHAGTHVDAPAHFIEDGATVDRLDPALLLGPCRVLELVEAPLITATALSSRDLRGCQRLLLRTRNSLHWQQDPTTFDRDFTALDVTAAHALLTAGIRLLGVDGLSVDAWESAGEVHGLLLSAGVVIIEGLNLSETPAGDYTLFCGPLRLIGSDGAPARVFLTR